MSGHSKWSKVKHQKATTDVAKAAAFTKASHAIAIAVRESGGITNPDQNFHLRLAMEKAREVNMPKETIERAIAKAAGAGGEAIESIIYEGYGPRGVAFLVEAATDNRQRTASAIKNVFDRYGGNLGGPGSVAYQFTKSGIIVVEKSLSFDALMDIAITAGADDVVDQTDAYEVYTRPEKLMEVKRRLEEAGLSVDNAELIMRPTLTVDPGDIAPKIEEMQQKLEEIADVQRVYTNSQ